MWTARSRSRSRLDLDLEIEKSLDKVRSSSELRTRYRNQVLDPDQGLSLDLDIYTLSRYLDLDLCQNTVKQWNLVQILIYDAVINPYILFLTSL